MNVGDPNTPLSAAARTHSVVRRGMIGRIAGLLAFASAAVLVALTGIAAMIEMLYYLTLESGSGTVMKLFGMETDVHHRQQSEMGALNAAIPDAKPLECTHHGFEVGRCGRLVQRLPRDGQCSV
jgi:hypothetical protein